MHIPGKISETFVAELFGIINPEEGLSDEFRSNPKDALKLIFEKLKPLAEINEIEREINIILNRLGTTNTFILTSYSIEELVIGVKHYLIAWSTMKDLMTNFINICYDLGIHESDVSFGVVIRNKKIRASRIPAICNKYEKTIKVTYTDKQRNDAIHRGKLLDDEINEFRSRYSGLLGRKFSLLNPEPISEEEFRIEKYKLDNELKVLVDAKKKEYLEHFELTMKLNNEITKELAIETANSILKKKFR